MKISVLGATGLMGGICVKEALCVGHEIVE
ncbi:hypothetical protein F892_02350 [Acinetobacter vivianii]|uniref:Semialdehyde dehydrogenase NAD-binding domain-containing protein n=1 Tax=Acinetobacter vivianii TaxID=1776742 RepID=N9Q865_9GAMM|nr:hypothetical protein F892_02350 [Acinetobacter vivianii]